MSDYDDYYEPELEEPDERPRDVEIDKAADDIWKIFEGDPSRVFYSTQIETSLERTHFHWITNKALVEMAAERRVQKATYEVMGNQVNFYSHTKNRYWRRDANALQKLLQRIFDPDFTQAVGQSAELLFDSFFAKNGFMRTKEKDIREWQGRIWTRTKHNLDRIVVRDGVAYGVEIKNTQNYIPKGEFEIKLDMCRELGLKPLFVMRYAPKSYMNQLYRRGGFGLLYERQIYPLGQTALLREVQQKLGLKVQAPMELEQGHGDRLAGWHEKTKDRT